MVSRNPITQNSNVEQLFEKMAMKDYTKSEIDFRFFSNEGSLINSASFIKGTWAN